MTCARLPAQLSLERLALRIVADADDARNAVDREDAPVRERRPRCELDAPLFHLGLLALDPLAMAVEQVRGLALGGAQRHDDERLTVLVDHQAHVARLGGAADDELRPRRHDAPQGKTARPILRHGPMLPLELPLALAGR